MEATLVRAQVFDWTPLVALTLAMAEGRVDMASTRKASWVDLAVAVALVGTLGVAAMASIRWEMSPDGMARLLGPTAQLGLAVVVAVVGLASYQSTTVLVAVVVWGSMVLE